MFIPNEISSAVAAEEARCVAFRALEDRLDRASGRIRRSQVSRRLAQRVRDRLPDLVGHLRAARRVEEREAVLQRREPPADRVDVHGCSPTRIRLSTAGSMLPPETMQTTFFAPPSRPERADRHRQRTRALRDHPSPLGDQPHSVGDLAERQRERAVQELRCVLPDARDQLTAARAVDEGRLVFDRGRRAGGEGCGDRRARLGLDREEAHVGARRLDRARDPRHQAAAAVRDDDRVEVRPTARAAPARSCRCPPSRGRCRRDGRTNPGLLRSARSRAPATTPRRAP